MTYDQWKDWEFGSGRYYVSPEEEREREEDEWQARMAGEPIEMEDLDAMAGA